MTQEQKTQNSNQTTAIQPVLTTFGPVNPPTYKENGDHPSSTLDKLLGWGGVTLEAIATGGAVYYVLSKSVPSVCKTEDQIKVDELEGKIRDKKKEIDGVYAQYVRGMQKFHPEDPGFRNPELMEMVKKLYPELAEPSAAAIEGAPFGYFSILPRLVKLLNELSFLQADLTKCRPPNGGGTSVENEDSLGAGEQRNTSGNLDITSEYVTLPSTDTLATAPISAMGNGKRQWTAGRKGGYGGGGGGGGAPKSVRQPENFGWRKKQLPKTRQPSPSKSGKQSNTNSSVAGAPPSNSASSSSAVISALRQVKPLTPNDAKTASSSSDGGFFLSKPLSLSPASGLLASPVPGALPLPPAFLPIP
jgi:hypothetical protein